MAASAAEAISEKTLTQINSGAFAPIIDRCIGCERIVTVNDQQYCKTYAVPAAKWKLGICNFATHEKPEIVTAQTRVNPLKASKRAAGKKKK